MIVRALSRRCSMFERLGKVCRPQNSYFSLDANENRDGKDDWRTELRETMKVFPDFITSQEEDSILQEIEPYMKRLRYEYSHWDDNFILQVNFLEQSLCDAKDSRYDLMKFGLMETMEWRPWRYLQSHVKVRFRTFKAIHGYRETERAKWNAENSKIIDRVRAKAFPPGTPQLGLVHVLDLAADGKIKPHVDSVRFCGDVIAGISLLSDCVMRMTLVGNEQNCREDFLLPRRSLYIMSGAARQKYKHEVLGKEESMFRGEKVEKGRRISVICRSEPEPRKDDT